MAISSLSASPPSFRQLQAQRAAEQAEQAARALRQRSDAAQREADRAVDTARSLKLQSDQAEGSADNARQGAASLKSLQRLGERLENTYQRVATAQSAASASPAPRVAVVVAPAVSPPGTVIDTTA